MKNKHRKTIKLYLVSGLILLGFNNCEQAGKIELKAKAPASNDGQGGGGGGGSGGGGGTNPPSYIDKSKMITVSGATASNKVDILIVIDNSGSMAKEQSNMAMRFGKFIDELKGLDWQVGIITTDVRTDANLRDGRLVPYPTDNNSFVLSSSMDVNLVKTLFAGMIQRSEQGSGQEQGIKSTYRALERALDPGNAPVNAPNRLLIRQDSVLAVLLVTDSDETWPDNGFEPRNDYKNLYNYVQTSWGGAKKFAYNAIIVKPGDEACLKKPDYGNETYGVNYAALAQMTGGSLGSVCDDDYSSQLSSIGQGVNLLVSSIQLECAPVDSNNDGKLDIAISRAYVDSSGAQKVEDFFAYSVVNNLVKSNAASFPAGNYSVSYRCVK